VRRRALLVLAALALAALGYQLFLRERSLAPHLIPTRAVAEIGAGSGAVGVSGEGAVLSWRVAPREPALPRLALPRPPPSGELTGTALQQARVLGAAPGALRPYLKASRYGQGGVVVELNSGIELRFGDDSAALRKWRAAAAILADPSVTALDYVELSAPARPAIGGSGHLLPPLP